MTYEVSEEGKNAQTVEELHDDLATEHGRDNVFVTSVDSNVIAIVNDGAGDLDPEEIVIEPTGE